MSRDETERFRITTWPAAIGSPTVIAVPRLVGLTEFRWEHDEPLFLETLANPERWRVVGPTSIRPSTGERFETDDDYELLVLAETEWAAQHEDAVAALADKAWRGDYGSTGVVYVDARPPDLVAIPDELFLREFLAMETGPEAIIEFVRSWGPLVAPYGAFRDEGVVHATPSPRFDFAELEAHREVTGRDDDEELRKAAESGDFRTAWELREIARQAERTRVAEKASAEILDAVLDVPWRSQTEHLIEVEAVLSDVLRDNEREGDDVSLVVRLAPKVEISSVRGYSLALQITLLNLYQAVFETSVCLEASDLEVVNLAREPRPELLEVWSKRDLPAPTTTFELIGTTLALLNEVTGSAGPRVELAHSSLDARGIAYGRPIPRVLTAMCLQALRYIADGVPARRCANETCERWFTRQRGRAHAGQFRSTGVLYCSSACAKAQAQRVYRRRRRAEKMQPS